MPAAVKLLNMLSEVAAGTFRPDAPRLEYFSHQGGGRGNLCRGG